jgi:hypothetical protein
MDFVAAARRMTSGQCSEDAELLEPLREFARGIGVASASEWATMEVALRDRAFAALLEPVDRASRRLVRRGEDSAAVLEQVVADAQCVRHRLRADRLGRLMPAKMQQSCDASDAAVVASHLRGRDVESIPYISGWGEQDLDAIRRHAAKVDEIARTLETVCEVS